MGCTVDLTFVRGDRLASGLIAWFSSGHLSHVDANLGNGQFLGAYERKVCGIPAGVQLRPVQYDTFPRRVTFSIPVVLNQRTAWLQFLHDQIGKPYDWTAIAGFVTGRNWRERDSWICSELQAAALEAAGIVPPLYLAANKITPVALALAVSALPGVTIKDEAPWRGM